LNSNWEQFLHKFSYRCVSSFVKAIFESLEETIYHLRCQLKEKEMELNKARMSLAAEVMKKDKLSQILR
jgi:hypothetical protein